MQVLEPKEPSSLRWDLLTEHVDLLLLLCSQSDPLFQIWTHTCHTRNDVSCMRANESTHETVAMPEQAFHFS